MEVSGDILPLHTKHSEKEDRGPKGETSDFVNLSVEIS